MESRPLDRQRLVWLEPATTSINGRYLRPISSESNDTPFGYKFCALNYPSICFVTAQCVPLIVSRLMFWALLTTLFWSASIFCAHRSAKMIGGTEANFWRLTLATIFLGTWAHLFGQ